MSVADLPPKVHETAIVWARVNLFSSLGNTILTLVATAVLILTVPAFIDWAFIRAVWHGDTSVPCLAPDAGACWPFITTRFGQIVYGFYDLAERWRVNIVYALGAAGLVWLTLPKTPHKGLVAILMLTVFPLVSYALLTGGWLGLPVVPTARWGGLLLTLVVSVTGIVFSLPLGVLLALGRRSSLPVIRWLSIVFIEVWRGVPMITVLFMASNMLPLFLPGGADVDKLLRALVAIALFSAAYMAETVRGGLQSVARGQEEAARALGLGYWTTTGLVVLPQALKLVIPAIVSNFISLFKDTSLVGIIGFFDLLGIIQAGNSDPAWATPNTAFTGYIFAGLVFWAFCFSMSRYSQNLERRLATEEHA
jgi:general L-amino acid transport system permease protein